MIQKKEQKLDNGPNLFSVCVLYNNKDLYEKLKKSLSFLDRNEYTILGLENFLNTLDCYTAILNFIKESRSRYLIICHQDVEFRGLYLDDLRKKIDNIQKDDPKAALFGVAGISQDGSCGVGHFYDRSGEHVWGFHQRGLVSSLDEFFLVLDTAKGITVSDNLKGFHFYGTNLCVNASKAGFTSYVIDFPVLHNCTPGKIQMDFFSEREHFQSYLQKNLGHGVIRTTCTLLYAGNKRLIEMFYFAKSIKILNKPSEHESKTECSLAYQYGSQRYGPFPFRLALDLCSIEEWLKKTLSSFSAIVRRIGSDLAWWKKNWRKRFYYLILFFTH